MPQTVTDKGLTELRFPPPWVIDEHPASFVVRDATGRALAHFDFDAENRRSITEQLSKNEARALACEFRCALAQKDSENDAPPEVERRRPWPGRYRHHSVAAVASPSGEPSPGVDAPNDEEHGGSEQARTRAICR